MKLNGFLLIVYYDLIEISGKEKKKFLKALDWKNLEKHINASKTLLECGQNQRNQRYSEMRTNLKSEQKVLV